jgi:hypothetical protein
MKKLIIIVIALTTVIPGLTFSQAGFIGLFSDSPSYMNCELVDGAPALHPVYVVHKHTPGAMGSRFVVTPSGGFGMVYLNETSTLPYVVGSSLTGVCIEYVDCLPSDILLLTINYFGIGTSTVCSRLEVVPDPATPSGTIEILNCLGERYAGGGGVLIVNNDGTCPCVVLANHDDLPESKPLTQDAAHARTFCPTSPAEQGSWGEIKALYK